MKNILSKLKSTKNPTRFCATALLTLNVMLLGLYIWNVNAASTAGFTMREFNENIGDMKTDLVRLDLEVARLQSIDSVTTRVQMLGLTKVENIEYIRSGASNVALNR
ncbi:hypothetical protein KJ766_01720 [Patescibacteria group bacterium]|nr:hypothetical protein [Patescibacteria group bacterium]